MSADPVEADPEEVRQSLLLGSMHEAMTQGSAVYSHVLRVWVVSDIAAIESYANREWSMRWPNGTMTRQFPGGRRCWLVFDRPPGGAR